MRPHADDLHHAADGSGLDELAGVDGAFHLQPFAVIYKVFSACFRDGFLYVGELLKCGERRFVGEIILPGLHHTDAEAARSLVTHAPATSLVSSSERICSSESAAWACGYCLRNASTFAGSGS